MEARGDPVPNWKLKIKWSGTYIVIFKINASMLLIRTMPLEKERYKVKNFARHTPASYGYTRGKQIRDLT